MDLQLETERLLIRPISMEDNQFMLELVNSEGWLRYIGDRQVKNLQDANSYIQKIMDTPDFTYSVLVLKETNDCIGITSFLKRANQAHPDFGFALLPRFQGQGFAYEASRKFLDEVIHQEGVSEIIALTMPENKDSIKLLKRLGFTPTIDETENNQTLSYFSLGKTDTEGSADKP